MELTIGKIFFLARTGWKYSKKEVCCGLCSHTAYARYESDERIPTKEMCDIIFQRLGFDSERVEYAVPVKTYGSKKNEADGILNRQVEAIEKAKNEYRQMKFEEAKAYLNIAWKYSRTDDINEAIEDRKMCVSNNELEIIFQYMMSEVINYNENMIESYIDDYYSGKSSNYLKRRLLNSIRLELLKKEIAKENYGNANVLYEGLKNCAI